MWEDVFQVYRRYEDKADLIASDMSLHDALLFMRAWLEEYYHEEESSLEIRRQPMSDESLRDTQEKMCGALCKDKEKEVETYTASESKDFKPIHIEETDKAVVIKSNEDELRKLLHECRNELCLRCATYRMSYSCDNCKWALGKEWETL